MIALTHLEHIVIATFLYWAEYGMALEKQFPNTNALGKDDTFMALTVAVWLGSSFVVLQRICPLTFEKPS